MASDNESFNADEMNAPAWLNAQFIEEVLRNYEKNTELRVIELKFAPASVKGDHYASVMFRATVEYTCSKRTISKSLIIKTMPEVEGHKKEMLGDSQIFETEIGMYTEVLPRFERILREAGDETVLYVPCIYHSLTPRKMMIFDDLVPQGYAVVRDRPPTMEELKCAFSKLAKWHAVSLKLLKEEPTYLNKFKHSFMDLPNILDDPFMRSGIGNFIEMLEKVPELSHYKPHFEKMRDNGLKRARESLVEYRQNHQMDAYYVLCHGDFHLRNMMFKNNKITGEFEDCMLLDFQMCNMGSMALDIIYSIYMLMEVEHRKNHQDELIYFYFSTLTETIKKIGYKGDIPSLVEFRRQIFQHRFFDFFLVTTFLPMMFAIKAGIADPDAVLQNEDIRKKCYYIKEYIEDLKRILAKFLHEGYFEN